MEELFDTRGAAEYLKHSVITLEQWRMKGKGPKFYKPSDKVLYYKEDLDAWIKDCAQPENQE